ncbi:MAG: hypothetical protein KJ804_13185 [Proteobacteria bacterium]|nr:hypothetical protein [Pseudomonadota bacterium]MBU1059261.1 hypothetical protein [Pseudomonadota bacterium]
MKGKLLSLVLAFTVVLIMAVGSAKAFENITAQEAYDMVDEGEAILIDVRTLEEVVWVGSPALEAGGDPIAYLIPWKFWTGVDATGNSTYEINEEFLAIVKQEFATDQALITMCRSGKRSTLAAELLETEGFTNVYEIDNALKQEDPDANAHGGFEGSNYGNDYNGYRGYPERLLKSNSPRQFDVVTVTEDIKNAEDSVSWKDRGLPTTQKVDLSLILTLE